MSERSIGSERTAGGAGSERAIEEIGARIGDRYEVLALIGQGGMGAVYRCRDARLGRDVAVKRLIARGSGAQAGLERFQREARAVASLNHRNIVVVHEYGDDSRGPYLVMELLVGKDLATLVGEKGALRVDEVKEIGRQVCAALSYAHRHRVIHRDVKPGNLFRLADGTVKVLDFGLARVGSESALSLEGFGLGTLDYVSPEQRRDASRVDHGSDLFSLGATLYFLATGKSPRTVRATDLPVELREFVIKLMEERPEDRYFSVDEALAALIKGHSATALATGAATTADSCPACGTVNAAEARYCAECGSGLYQTCPVCDKEDRVGRRFCTKCGANIPAQRQAREHAERGDAHEKARAWSRAEKEWAEALRLRPDWKDARTALERAKQAQARVLRAHEHAAKAAQARDIGDLRAAVAELSNLLASDDASLVELRDGTLASLETRRAAVERSLDAAESMVASGTWAAAESALSEARAAWPGDPRAERIASTLRRSRLRFDEQIGAARVALDEWDYRRAESALELAAGLAPRDANLAALRARAASVRAEAEAAAGMVADAERLLGDGKLAGALERISEAERRWPGLSVVLTASERIHEAESELSDLILRASSELDGGDIDGAISTLASACWLSADEPAAVDLRARLASAQARRKAADECAAEAGRLLVAGDLRAAITKAAEGESIWPGHVEAARIHAEAKQRAAQLENALADGNARLARGALAGAKRCVDTAMALAPRDGRVLELRKQVAERGRRINLRRLLLGLMVVLGGYLAVGLLSQALEARRRGRTDRSTSAATIPAGRTHETAAAAVSWADVLEVTPDPKVVLSERWRNEIERTGYPWRVKDKRTGIELLLVPPGEYERGASSEDSEAGSDERPRHRVTLSRAFYLGRYEVLQTEWAPEMDGDNPSSNKAWERFPVENVSHDDVQRFLAKTGLRLPTEAEWEYACRADTTGPRYGVLDAIAWHGSNSRESTHPVGAKLGNALGFHDMLGNVSEWCSDWYGGEQEYARAIRGVTDPAGPSSGQTRVVRGGSWLGGDEGCRASNRDVIAPENRFVIIGFRVARTP